VQITLDKLIALKLTEINFFYLNREKRKIRKRARYKEIDNEIFLFLPQEINFASEKSLKELKIYIVSPLAQVNEIKIDIDYFVDEAYLYIVSPFKKIKDEFQGCMVFLLDVEVNLLSHLLMNLKETKTLLDGGEEDVFISVHE